MPTGYTNTQGCANVPLNIGGNAGCTLINVLNSATLTVNKDFVAEQRRVGAGQRHLHQRHAFAGQRLGLSEATPFTTTITGFIDRRDLHRDGDGPDGLHAPTRRMRQRADQHRRNAELHDHEHAEQRHADREQGLRAEQRRVRSVSVTCSSGTPSPASGSASESTPFSHDDHRLHGRRDLHGDRDCAGRLHGQPDELRQRGDQRQRIAQSCTIVNSLNTATFVVAKDFSPNNGGPST